MPRPDDRNGSDLSALSADAQSRAASWRGARHSLISFVHGSPMRRRCVPKSTRMTISSSTPMMLPRPYLSCVTKSPTAKVSTGLSTAGRLKGLPGSWRLDGPARDGFTSPHYARVLCRRTPRVQLPGQYGRPRRSATYGAAGDELREQLRCSRSGAPSRCEWTRPDHARGQLIPAGADMSGLLSAGFS